MGLKRALLSTIHFCEHCQKETRFVPIYYALALTGRSRPTLYYWMKHSWIHWLELPSGRRLICEQALIRKAHSLETDAPIAHPRTVNNRPSRTLPL
jgi:predicted DNA-binding transcriptional regulator AlpA